MCIQGYLQEYRTEVQSTSCYTIIEALLLRMLCCEKLSAPVSLLF